MRKIFDDASIVVLKDLFIYFYLLERVRIVRELRDLTVTAGENAHFVCELSHSDVTDGVWWLDSTVLQENEMNQMRCCGREHHLTLTMTTPEESGIVAFVVGEEWTSARLRVNSKPKGENGSEGPSAAYLPLGHFHTD